MFWDVRAVRKALRQYEGKNNKQQYSETIFRWMRRELERHPSLKIRPDTDIMVLLGQILVERRQFLAAFLVGQFTTPWTMSRSR